ALGIGCAALVIALPLQQVLPDKKAAVTEGRAGKTAETAKRDPIWASRSALRPDGMASRRSTSRDTGALESTAFGFGPSRDTTGAASAPSSAAPSPEPAPAPARQAAIEPAATEPAATTPEPADMIPQPRPRPSEPETTSAPAPRAPAPSAPAPSGAESGKNLMTASPAPSSEPTSVESEKPSPTPAAQPGRRTHTRTAGRERAPEQPATNSAEPASASVTPAPAAEPEHPSAQAEKPAPAPEAQPSRKTRTATQESREHRSTRARTGDRKVARSRD